MQEVPAPEGLPVWLQTLLYLGGILGAFAAAWKGWISKKPQEAENTIVAADIMSTKPMRELGVAVQDLTTAVRASQGTQERILDALNRQTDAERATEQAVRDLCRDQSRSFDRLMEQLDKVRPRPRP